MLDFKQLGGKIDAQHNKTYAKSPNWYKGAFRNIERTRAMESIWKIPGVIYRQIKNNVEGYPARPIGIKTLDVNHFLDDSVDLKYVWYGHSVILFRMAGKTILIDPMFGPDCAPIGPVRSPRFSENTLDIIDDLPEIDLVLFTHDHYDHIDMASVLKLKSKVKSYLVPLGVKRHLLHWEIKSELIDELDWWKAVNFHDIKITFTPTRHFSGRGLRDRAKSLWGGFLLESQASRVWVSGDGGYGSHFNDVAQVAKDVDVAFMECGQYNKDWPQVHMFPEQAVSVAKLALAKTSIPIHWAGFNLSYQHHWYEPAEAFIHNSKKENINYSLPEPGKVYSLNDRVHEQWWDTYKK